MAKMVTCKSCGAQIAKTANRCPKCGARQHQAAMAMVSIIVVLAVVGIVWIVATSGSGESASAKANATASTSTASVSNASKEIYSDKTFSVSFVKKYDESSIPGEFFFSLQATNKSSQKITLALQDVYLNGTIVQTGSGTPFDLLTGKNGNHSFFGKYDGTGISNATEIKKIGFKVVVMDENANVIETTNQIEVAF